MLLMRLHFSMHLLMLANTRSGTGRSRQAARDIASILTLYNHHVRLVDPIALSSSCLTSHCSWAHVILIAGGDGTIHHLLPHLIMAAKPIYHIGTGTENLFARHFHMLPTAEALLQAIHTNRTTAVDTFSCALIDRQSDTTMSSPSPAALMASLGPDAAVVHRLAAVRSRAGSHAMYLRPIVAELLHPHLVPLSITVDDTLMVNHQRGILIIANSLHYACRANPLPGADMADGLLDMLFLPATTITDAIRWTAKCLAQTHILSPQVQQAQGRTIVVESSKPVPVQCDGEAAATLSPNSRLIFRVQPRSLEVLLPPSN